MSTLFVTATGTGVGKTFVTAALAHRLRGRGEAVSALKPVVTGYDADVSSQSDPAILLDALGKTVGREAINAIAPFRYRAPLAPLMAAHEEGRPLDFAALVAFCRREMARAPGTLMIEGVGGVMVPLAGRKTVLDWIAALECPALLVAGSYLGTLSHTLTAFEALVRRGIFVTGIVVCASEGGEVALDDTSSVIGGLTGVPALAVARISGRQPWMEAPDLTSLVPA